MRHLESAFTGKNHPWRYIVMLVAVFLASNTIGAIPLFLVYLVAVLTDPSAAESISANPADLAALNTGPNLALAVMLVPFAISLVAFALIMKPLHNRPFLSVINGTGSFRWNRYILAFTVWASISVVYFLIYMQGEPQNFELNNNSITLLYIALVALLLIPFQAGLEEVVFRGYLMQGFGIMSRNRWVPVLLTSLLFGLLHSFNPEVKEYGFFAMMPQYMVFGLIFGIATVLDDGIETAMGAHAANNIFLVIMVTHESSALQTPALYRQLEVIPWLEFGGLVVSGLLFLLIIKYLLKWKSGVLLTEVQPLPGEEHEPTAGVL